MFQISAFCIDFRGAKNTFSLQVLVGVVETLEVPEGVSIPDHDEDRYTMSKIICVPNLSSLH